MSFSQLTSLLKQWLVTVQVDRLSHLSTWSSTWKFQECGWEWEELPGQGSCHSTFVVSGSLVRRLETHTFLDWGATVRGTQQVWACTYTFAQRGQARACPKLVEGSHTPSSEKAELALPSAKLPGESWLYLWQERMGAWLLCSVAPVSKVGSSASDVSPRRNQVESRGASVSVLRTVVVPAFVSRSQHLSVCRSLCVSTLLEQLSG